MINHITAMGRLTHDPELRHTASGVAVCSFSIVCERDYRGGSKRWSAEILAASVNFGDSRPTDADPGLTIPANHGLLHAGQVGYLLRTAARW